MLSGLLIFIVVLINIGLLLKRIKLASNIWMKGIIVAMYLIHFGLSYFYYQVSITSQFGDAYDFYHKILDYTSWKETFDVGSEAVSLLIYPLVKMGCSFALLFFGFATISIEGFFLYLSHFTNQYSRSNNRTIILSVVLLTPTLHYWTGFLGKEAIVFYAMSYFLCRIRKLNFWNIKTIILFFLVLFLRPYLGILLLIALFTVIYTDKNIGAKFKVNLIKVLTPLFLIGLILFKMLLNISFSIQAIRDKFKFVNEYAISKGKSVISIYETSYVERIIALLFRPFVYETYTKEQLFVALELMFFFILCIWALFKIQRKKWSIDVRFAFYTAILIILFLSIYIYNLGLASRMRVMFVPYIIYVFGFLIERKNEEAY